MQPDNTPHHYPGNNPRHSTSGEPSPAHASPLPPPPPSRRDKQRREGTKSIISTIAILVTAPLVALLLIAFVFQSYEVDGPSMEHTLQHQDRLLVLKTGKTWARITGQDYIPERGEIIVFAKTGTFDPVAGGKRQLIKRVLGEPGDRVTVIDGQITVFNDDNPDGFDPDEAGGYVDDIASRGGATDIDITVPEGYVFVLGDNRSNSLDSRTFGIVSSDEIVGRLVLRIFPFNEMTTF